MLGVLQTSKNQSISRQLNTQIYLGFTFLEWLVYKGRLKLRLANSKLSWQLLLKNAKFYNKNIEFGHDHRIIEHSIQILKFIR